MAESTVTKKAIAEGFKSLMTKKHFEKITISDITAACGLNRQTFYYHFQDKYELLNWIFYNEVIAPLMDGLTIDNWSDKLEVMLVTMKKDVRFYSNALNTPYSSEFRDYLFKVTATVVDEIIDRIADGQTIKDYDKQFITEFFSYGITGCTIKWITSNSMESPENVAVYLKNLVNDCKSFAVARYVTRQMEQQPDVL